MTAQIDVGQELLNVPMGEMVQSLALSIAQAQWQLDKASMTVAELMSGQRILRNLDDGQLTGANNEPLPAGSDPIIVDSRVMFGYEYSREGNKVVRRPQKVSMLELGFTPVFYQFVDTIIEVKISITMTGSSESSYGYRSQSNSTTYSYENSSTRSWWYYGNRQSRSQYQVETRTSTVDAKYSSKYGYSIEGASLLRTKLVPIPPPSILEDRIRQVMEDGEIWRDWIFKNAIKSDGTVVHASPPEPVRCTVKEPVAGGHSVIKITVDDGEIGVVKDGWQARFGSGNVYTITSATADTVTVDTPIGDEDRAEGLSVIFSPPTLLRELPL